MVNRLVLVGCGDAKSNSREYAYRMYDSDYFSKKLCVAMLLGEPTILSAEHGLLRIEEKIDPYNTSIDELDDAELDKWVDDVLESIDFDRFDEIVVLAGKDYVNPLREELDKRASHTYYPFDYTSGIGEQKGWLKEAPEMLRNGYSMYGALP